MKERPILFSAPMVRAILSGTKKHTRRIVTNESLITLRPDGTPGKVQPRSKFGQPGDRLWVRETWAPHPQDDTTIFYRAKVESERGFPVWDGPWKPSIFMPRWASRITLEITDVRVERLQDISESDAVAEGCKGKHTADADWTACNAYRVLWESINGGGSWDANPFVWVVEFKRVTT